MFVVLVAFLHGLEIMEAVPSEGWVGKSTSCGADKRFA